MSGIAGIVRFDGGVVEKSEMHAMAEAVAHRGGDASAIWSQSQASLAQQCRWTTPEAQIETLPLRDAENECTLVADARIDNRTELISLLFPRVARNEIISDERLILHAFSRFSSSAPTKLVGDFSFAIWNEAKGELFCSRDFAGVRPFYYTVRPGKYFAFASEIKALLTLSDLDSELDRERFADFLIQINSNNEYTFYRHIKRLPAGCSATISRDGIDIKRHYEFDPNRETVLGSDEEYADAFQEIFTNAVRVRLRSRSPVAATLSGGLDSSAVVATASLLTDAGECDPIHTFSAIFNTVTECDEREFIDELLRDTAISAHFVEGDLQHPLADLPTLVAVQDEPFIAPNVAMMWRVYSAINQAGFRTVLSGHGGDETVSHGLGYLRELAQLRRFFALFRELSRAPRLPHQSVSSLYLSYLKFGLSPLHPTTFSQRIHRRMWNMVAGTSSLKDDPDLRHPIHLVSDAMRSNVQLDDRLAEWKRNQNRSARSEREMQLSSLSSPLQQATFEISDRTTNACGLDLRYPFWDKNVVEFCLSLPASQKLRRGHTRFILKNGLRNILPEKIRERKGKTDFSQNVVRGITHNDRSLFETVEDDLDPIAPFVKVPDFLRLFSGKALNGTDFIKYCLLLNFFSVALWLQQKKASY